MIECPEDHEYIPSSAKQSAGKKKKKRNIFILARGICGRMVENNSEDSLEFIIDRVLNIGERREKGNVSSTKEADSDHLRLLHSKYPME